jgi:hypothetical protein
MSKQQWKYKDHLNTYANCPPQSRKSILGKSFRWVREQLSQRDFLPVGLMPGAVPPGTPPCCNHYSLSFFATAQNAEKRLLQILDRHPKFTERVGNCIAEVAITSSDGEATPQSGSFQHFEFFEYESAQLHCSAVVVKVIQ